MNERSPFEKLEKEYFGLLAPYIEDDSITDIDYNGRNLWLTDCNNHRWKADVTLPEGFVEQFTKRISNLISKPFHKQSPILEAETDTLRITIVHESVALSGRCICIRKSLPYVRLKEDRMIRDQYCSMQMMNFLKECVREKKNIVFCGPPGVGKTECAKFFSGFIPAEDRVITIEDTPEWHFKELHPEHDCVELRINDQMGYTEAIKTCLRLNPRWIMLSETRSEEVVYLIEGFSTGVKGITTLHTDDVRKIPDRMLNMAGGKRNPARFENDIYNFIDVGVLLNRKMRKAPDGQQKVMRYMDQICLFERKGDRNVIRMVAEDGRMLEDVKDEGDEGMEEIKGKKKAPGGTQAGRNAAV